MDAPVISVIVTVYNHGPYVERCLRGILMQRCDHPFEVWVGEDCSPDDSREVMRRIEPEFPDNFHFLYREHNLGDANNTDLIARCRGRYLAICEGDDFWTYEGKLQEQVDFLEAHPEYVACYHHCTVVGEDSLPNGERYPDCLADDYSFRENFLCTMPGQTSTSVVRMRPYLAQKERFLSFKRFDSYPEDRRNAFILLTVGKVKVFQEAWGAYRHVTHGGTSYSAQVKVSETYARNEVLFGQTLVDYALASGNPEAVDAARRTYYRLLLKWSVGRVRVASLADSLRELAREPHALRYLLSVPRWYAILGVRALAGRGVTL
ncbi:glycosyltransferase family A protein [Olsenella sp. HMSC062G07]|uniref:glycosyltransferase family 2 protein n=1 Tax=Olsenella sp. HMSC062G07 TaxID=1739330 RepID=UPI0008A5F74D|nr:glycosyltransferase family A protein [Olsenella sp. HMSC062G07]OFK24124.1 hypothetical protein HMPREF2826_08340 [Olsenella sp. HMSC062G07]